MVAIHFDNEDDAYAVVNALRVAADRFDQDAEIAKEQSGLAYQRLTSQFVIQAEDARRIATKIENDL